MAAFDLIGGPRVEGSAQAVYAERGRDREGAFDAWARAQAGGLADRVRPQRRRLIAWVREANRLETAMRGRSDDSLRFELLRSAVSAYALESAAMVSALAAVRELAHRMLGKRPYDCQLQGAAGLLAGRFIEMDTGEGKTLTAGLAAAIAAAARVPVHVVTVNDYLAERDARTLEPLYRVLGLTVGTIRSGLEPGQRRAIYASHVVYCTNKELVFDYLKDRVAAAQSGGRAQIALRELHGLAAPPELLLRGLCFAIVDEGDSVLIDEARTPLILSQRVAQAPDDSVYRQALTLAGALHAQRDFRLLPAERDLQLTTEGLRRADALAAHWSGGWRVEQARRRLVEQALRALHLFRRDEHYIVSEGKVQIVDEYTGRVLDGRKWEQGLHPMIELKEGCEISEPVRTIARISYQRFFCKYLRLAAMSGTAREVASELRRVYRLPVVRIAPNRPNLRRRLPDRLLPDASAKWDAVLASVRRCLEAGRPVLVGTRSVATSEALSACLAQAGIAHRVLNARQDADEAALVAQAGWTGGVTVATNMAGRGTDIALDEEVRSRGGLHVVLTEFHSASRIDRQLFGRCARQGDPGSCEAIVALDDDLARRHAPGLRAFVAKAGPGLRRAAISSLLRRVAQAHAERSFARVRKQTLRVDEELDRTLAYAANRI